MSTTNSLIGAAVIDAADSLNPEAIMGVVEYVTEDGWVGVRDCHTGRLDELPWKRALVLGPGVRAYEEGWVT